MTRGGHSAIAPLPALQIVPRRAEKPTQRRNRLLDLLFWKEMPAGDRPAVHIVRPAPPDAERSACVRVPLIERSAPAPKHEHRTPDLPRRLPIRLVAREVGCRRRAVFLADRMHRRAV